MVNIRKYEAKDRLAVRRLCCDTGFLGSAIDPVYQDREVFADFLTDYYLTKEPQNAFVVDVAGELRGYLLGCSDPAGYRIWSIVYAVRAAAKLFVHLPAYSVESLRFIRWMLLNAQSEVPPAPKGTPHFHINLLEDVRNVKMTRELIDLFLVYLRSCGAKAVYGQMVTFSERRGERMFERYGFRVLNRSEITKYRAFYNEPVYLCTVLKDLTSGVHLYDRDGDRRSSIASTEISAGVNPLIREA
jgi:hypothetical protein